MPDPLTTRLASARRDQNQEAQAAAQTRGEEPFGRLNILVVEDDLQLRDALCLTLECAGHHVIGAADGPAALRLFEREAFNLVVSDLRMQPMDGIELLKAIRGREAHLPVLLMTAFGDVDKAVSAMRAGACDFLLKPFEPKVLLEHVARYAARPQRAEGVVADDARTRNLLALAARVAKKIGRASCRERV